MNHSSGKKLATAVISLLLIACSSLYSAENSSALFQYATPLEVEPIFTAQLAELRLTKPIYNALRSDFADIRIVRCSDNGVVPHRCVRLGAPDYAPVQRSFALVEKIPADLLSRYPQSVIVLIETERVPLTGMRVSFDRNLSGCGCLLLGEGGAHAAGAEWRLLQHTQVEERAQRIDLAFEESSFARYAFIADSGDRAQFEIESVSGPDYCVYFEIHPGESYTLLCGYPDALPIPGLNAEAIERSSAKNEQRVQVRVTSLIKNELWSSRSLKSLAVQCSFLIPLAVVLGVVVVLLVFVIVYTLVNRKRPLKIGYQPRFFK